MISDSSLDSRARGGMVWLGGLFDAAETWKGNITDGIHVDADSMPCEFQFPESPKQCVTAFAAKGEIPAWFDMKQIPLDPHVVDYGCSLDQALSNVALVHKLIDDMIASGIVHDRIMVGGFSQGGAMAILAAMQYPKRLAGAVNFAGPLLGVGQLEQLKHVENANLNILWCHGTLDKPMPQVLQADGVRALEAEGMKVEVATPVVAHHGCPEFYDSMKRFMKVHMPA